MKETFYFSHDFNANSDPKIRAMMRKHKIEGYGIYWYIIELLAAETGRWYLPTDYEGLAYEMRTQSERIKSVVQDYGLFEFDENNFWNKRLDSHFLERAKKSKQASDAAKEMHRKRKLRENNRAVASNQQCETSAIKERKGKEIKENIYNSGIDKFLSSVEFNEFWELYPKKTAKASAMKKWNEIVDNPKEVLSKIKKAIKWQKVSGCLKEYQFSPKPEKYIEGECWNDKPPAQEEHNNLVM